MVAETNQSEIRNPAHGNDLRVYVAALSELDRTTNGESRGARPTHHRGIGRLDVDAPRQSQNARVAEVQLRCRCMCCGKWEAAHTLRFAREPRHAIGLRLGAQEREMPCSQIAPCESR